MKDWLIDVGYWIVLIGSLVLMLSIYYFIFIGIKATFWDAPRDEPITITYTRNDTVFIYKIIR